MNRSVALVLALGVISVGACGDDDRVQPDAGTSDAPTDAVAPLPTAVVVSGDFSATGIMSKLDIESLTMAQNVAPAGAVSGDPVLREIGGRLYVVNRFGFNSITVLDARTLALVDQYATGANTNPQDVAVVGRYLYVAVLGGVGAVKIDTMTGDATPLDLDAVLQDPADDGNPDCVSAYAVGNKVYMACGLLDSFAAVGPGKLAVIDTAASDSVTAVALPAANPLNFFVRAPQSSVFAGDLLIPTVPSYSDFTTGCVVRVSTGTTAVATCAAGLSNADLGGFVQHLDIAADGSTLYLAVGTLDSNFMNPTGKLRAFDLDAGTLASTPLSGSSQLIVDHAACPDGSVVAVDSTMNASGLRVFANGSERTTSALAIGLPPAYGNNLVCYDAR